MCDFASFLQRSLNNFISQQVSLVFKFCLQGLVFMCSFSLALSGKRIKYLLPQSQFLLAPIQIVLLAVIKQTTTTTD